MADEKQAEVALRTSRIAEASGLLAEFPGQLWDVTVIRAGHSANGEFFAPDVLREAAPQFRGVPVYLYRFAQGLTHHLPDAVKEKFPNGIFGNRVGTVVDAAWSERDQAIVGRVSFSDQVLVSSLRHTVKASPGTLPQLSIDIRALMAPDTIDGKAVQRILRVARVDSLDIVTYGAAGGALERIAASDQKAVEALLRGDAEAIETIARASLGVKETETMSDIRTVEGLRAAHPEILAAAVAQGVEPERTARAAAEKRLTEAETAHAAEVKRLTEANAALTKERDETKAKFDAAAVELDKLKAKEAIAARKETVTRVLEASKLKPFLADKKVVSDNFRAQLEACADEAAMKPLIADREALIEGRTAQAHGDPVLDPTGTSTRLTEAQKAKIDIIDGVFGAPAASRADQGDIVVRIPKSALNQAQA